MNREGEVGEKGGDGVAIVNRRYSIWRQCDW